MADSTRSQVQLRKVEENWNARFTSMNRSVDDKLTALSDSLSNSFNNKLDSKITEVFEAINRLTSIVLAASERSPSLMQSEGRQQARFVDWTRTSATPDPDLLKASSTENRFRQVMQGENRPSASFTDWNRRFRQMMQGENWPPASFTDWNHSPSMDQDLYRSSQQQAPTEMLPQIGDSFNPNSPCDAINTSTPGTAASLVDQENIEKSSSQGREGVPKILDNSGIDLEHFCESCSFKIAETEEKHLWILDFNGKNELDVWKLYPNGSNGDAYKLFDKMPKPILATKLSRKATAELSRIEEPKKVDFMKFTCDPGGGNHKNMSMDCDKLVFEGEPHELFEVSFEGILVGGLKGYERMDEAINLRIQQWDRGGRKEGIRRAEIGEMLVTAVCCPGRKQECKLATEFDGLLQDRPSKIKVFDPGGGLFSHKGLW